jgi:hypothetical protein
MGTFRTVQFRGVEWAHYLHAHTAVLRVAVGAVFGY